MREIKFRGKRVTWREEWEHKEWLYGDIIHLGDRVFWTKQTPPGPPPGTLFEELDPATVGQFTGLKDAKGRDVYEGDRLRDVLVEPPDDGYHHLDDRREWTVAFADGAYFAYDDDEADYILGDFVDEAEIIGNIHDTPSLERLKRWGDMG